MRSLRTWALVLPPAFLAALLAVEEFVLLPHLGRAAAALLVLVGGALGTVIFSLVIWRLIGASEEAVRDALAAERRLSEQMDALSAATLALTSDPDVATVLQRVVDLSRRIIGARYGALAVVSPDGLIESFLTSGLDPAVRARLGPPPQGHGLLGVVLNQHQSLRLDDLTRDPRSVGFSAGHPEMRALLAVPIAYGDTVIGSLYLAEEDAGRTFTEADQGVLERFAAQAAVAVVNARLYDTARRVSALEERQRIAMDLHDGALQAVYGASLALQAALGLVESDPAAALRAGEQVVDRLDAVSGELRGFLTARLAEERREGSFVNVMRQLLDSIATGLEVERRLIVQGEFGDVPRQVLWELWHVVHEALANSVRHGKPRRIDLHLTRSGDNVQVAVQDDGAGFDPAAPAAAGHHGLANMRRRTESLGGRLVVLGAVGHGVTVVADIPLADPEALAPGTGALATPAQRPVSSAGPA